MNAIDELIEVDEGDMVSVPERLSGIDHTIFASTKGVGRHAARVKIAMDPPRSLNETCDTASMTLHDYRVIGAYMPPRLVEQVKRFIELNREALAAYWEAEIDTLDFLQRLKSIRK